MDLMMKKMFPKLMVLLLILCMVLPQAAMAAVPEGATCYIELTIEDDKENLEVSDVSSKYLTGASPLAAEVVTLINKNYDEMEVFRSPAMKRIMDEGLSAFRGSDAIWQNYLNKYFDDVDNVSGGTDFKALLADKLVTLNALTPDVEYKISFQNDVPYDAKFGTTYTVTVVLRVNEGSGSAGGDCPYYEPCPSLPYSDLNTSMWYHESVDYMLENGIMIGTGASKFSPNGTVTRGTLMTMLARLDGEDTTGSNPWYQIGMEWAVAEGVSDGTNPQANVTREQIVTMLYRYAGSPAVSGSRLAEFPDGGNVSSWAKDGMNWAIAAGIINGTGAGTLNPQGEASRVELAAMFHRFCVNVLNK